MPPKDRHGKTAQDYRAALIAELDAVPDYHRRRKAQRSPLLFVWLLVPVALLWLNWSWVQQWWNPSSFAEPSLEGVEIQATILPLSFVTPAPCQARAASQSWMRPLNGRLGGEEACAIATAQCVLRTSRMWLNQGIVLAAQLFLYKSTQKLFHTSLFLTP